MKTTAYDVTKVNNNVRGVTVQKWSITISNLTRVVHDNDLRGETCRTLKTRPLFKTYLQPPKLTKLIFLTHLI